jgi:hypothetical protein
MGAFLSVIVLALLLAAAGLRVAKKARVACWLMVVFPSFLCLAYLRDLAQGPSVLGAAAYVSDQKQLAVALVMLAISIFAAWRAQWRWLFWIEWFLNGIVCGMLIYLVFFWKLFT